MGLMHWDVWAFRAEGCTTPGWRARLCNGGSRVNDLEFTFYELQGIVGLVRGHDRLYPVYLCCYWSPTVEREARAALQRCELTLTESCIPF